MTTTNVIDELVSKQVNSGLSSSKAEAEQQLMANLVEREIDRRIAQGRQDIKEGKFTPVNEQTTAEFTCRLSKQIITQNT